MEHCRNASLDSVMKAVTTAHIDLRAAPIQGLSPAGLHFLKQLLRRDPVLRITADEALEHDFFRQHLETGVCDSGDRENSSAAANQLDGVRPAGEHCSLLRYMKFCELCSLEN